MNIEAKSLRRKHTKRRATWKRHNLLESTPAWCHLQSPPLSACSKGHQKSHMSPLRWEFNPTHQQRASENNHIQAQTTDSKEGAAFLDDVAKANVGTLLDRLARVGGFFAHLAAMLL
jgi:hypothetical protein